MNGLINSLGINSFHGAGSAKVGMPLCHLSAYFTNGLESQRCSSNYSSVINGMAILAKGNAVRNIIAKRWIFFPGFYMVSVNQTDSPAFLTFVVVALKNILNPLFIFITVPTRIIFVLLQIVSAFFGTAFLSMTATNKILSAYLTGKNFCFVKFQIASFRAKAVVLSEILSAANLTGFVNSVIRHTSIIPHFERMHAAFPELEIKRMA